MFFQYTHYQNRGIILRNIIQLRLAVLLVAFMCIVVVDAWFVPLDHFGEITVLLFAVACWSIGSVYWRKPHSNVAFGRLFSESLLDAFWVFALVILSGRSANPFIYYYVVLVAISASVYSTRVAWLYSSLGILAYTALLYFDINQHFKHFEANYQLHLIGMWLNFVGSTIVTCFFVNRLASALREHQQKLEKAREDTLKSEQLVGVGTIAASTVHALATPLSTLTVLLEGFAPTMKGEQKDDVDIMLVQIERCKNTMHKLSLLSQREAVNWNENIENLFRDLKEHYVLAACTPLPVFMVCSNARSAIVSQALLLRHALLNLINNAVDAAQNSVSVSVDCIDQQAFIIIKNDGEGFSDEMIQQWGNPVQSNKANGLGIGTFLANSTIEKLGGTVEIRANDAQPSNDVLSKANGSGVGPLTVLLVTLPIQQEVNDCER